MNSNSSSSMRGLTQYIADLRACRVRELEERRINKEMAHIRAKFKEGQLDGYQKKKYLSKIVFTYILGYQVDIGHMEAVNLIASTKYSEKQIGYLAITLLMHENSDIVRLVVNSIRKDLDEISEVNNCLALHAIANIGGKEMAEALAGDVHRLLISPTSRSFVKKKAALTLLRLYRKHPDVIPADEWALRIIAIMDDDDLGVALAVTSLVMAMAQDHPHAFATSYNKAVLRMHRIVVENDFTAEYVYYKVPIPWLQVKLLRLLQYYPSTEDPTLRRTLETVLDTIINNSQESPKNVQHNNAQNAILFEAINLAIQLDTESAVVAKAAVLLGRFILSRETNVRYLGLDTMAHLAACAESLEPIKMHQNTIILSLRDKDISVRRRGVDLLYSMCDVTNARVIVSELLKYMQIADYALREEMVLKIAILTEKFATEYAWYVDTILQLISSAGDHVSDEVWYRVIQIVVNNEDVQEYAATKVLEHLKSTTCHENMIKVGGYILGEFGHLIANDPGASPIEQFHTLHSRSHLCSQSTRALLLSTYVKWLNLFPEIREQILYVLNRYRHVLDAELQQRACEYVALAEMPDDELLQAVCDEMPPFAQKSSLLLSRLHKKHTDTEDKRTWIIGGKDSNRGREEARLESLKKGKANGGAMPTGGNLGSVIRAGHPSEAVTADSMRSGAADDADNVLAGLEGLDMNAPSSALEDAGLLSEQPLIGDEASPAASKVSTPATPATPVNAATFSAGSDKYFQRLCFAAEGVLYEDSQMQIGLKSEYHAHQGRLALYFGNKIGVNFSAFSVSVRSGDAGLSVSVPKIPTNVLGAMTQAQTVVLVECHDLFTQPPVLEVSYLAGSLHEIRLRLPVLVSKFIEPVQLGATDFFERWRQIGGPPREAQKIFGFRLSSAGEVDVTRQRRIIEGARLQHLDGVDPNPTNSVAAGVLHMARAGKVGCLLRLEPNRDAKLARLTVRTTNDLASAELLRILLAVLGTDEPKL
ncbi:adaptor protein complex AP-2 alpha subunit [Moesziomyces antarcticus]|uniref:AP-2 complex subunit alpha n=2 Tax=Pseudozyma antarctica TaxID=84753 RepID=A0A081CE27_PSEA2|nr:adaptor protein complex AP-2 alpha subunit [Moesziomyces antarcticus]GAK64923.1 adaptor protein complex AP-2 alpha subunit [Moesziomyces antarcticus]SPO46092.1 probable alpha-adaptin C [Moesziomyces antarcticus]